MKLSIRKLHKFKYSKPSKLNTINSDFVLVIATSKTLKNEFGNLKSEFNITNFPKQTNSLHLVSPNDYKCKQLVLLNSNSKKEALFKEVQAITKYSDTITKAKTGTIWIDPSIKEQELLVNMLVNTINNINYKFDYFLPEKLKHTLTSITFMTEKVISSKKLEQFDYQAYGSSITKDLANMPGNICTPEYIAKTATDLFKSSRSVKVNIYSRDFLRKKKMGAFLAVAQGSVNPPKLIELKYNGAGKDAPIVLVGKGITFDTGGVNLKPSNSIDGMKFDMTGAATVLGTFCTIAKLKPKINLVALLACAENMPDGNAYRTDDIITTMSGQTVEVINTDAEGRLVLCDTLTYAQAEHNPKEIIDLATLTGACVVALGSHATGVMSNSQNLANNLIAAGEQTGDRAWQLPLWQEYHEQIKSNVAEIANCGTGGAGTITAAAFLEKFIDAKQSWAHLDIAGSSCKYSGKDRACNARPLPLLVDYLNKR
jgi:leucyl aminopeptidase